MKTSPRRMIIGGSVTLLLLLASASAISQLASRRVLRRLTPTRANRVLREPSPSQVLSRGFGNPPDCLKATHGFGNSLDCLQAVRRVGAPPSKQLEPCGR